MTELAFTRCARPTLTSRRISTYTIMGFGGYAIANVVGSVLANVWDLTLGERLIGFLAPPLAFIVTVTIASAIAKTERIVFYQTACAGIAAVVGIGLLARVRVERLVDLATLGIGVFLVFGRIGCFSVACCHGTLGRGVTYGPPHVDAGFWRRWSGRPLWPVQLVEAVASALLVVVAIASSGTPGTAAAIYILGYAAVRFALELVRGDALRPYARGLSEAQWVAVATAAACALWQRDLVTMSIVSVLAIATIVLVATRRKRELFIPPHLHELDRAMAAADDGARHETSLGLGVSRHGLPDGRIDWILSAERADWSEAAARRLAHALFPTWELVPGRTPGVIHLLTPPASSTLAA